MNRRTQVALAAAATLALLATWIVRAPMISRPVARPPDIDIDPPAMRARRQAAIALATMPADPWTFAQSIASSAPASGVEGAAKEHCGIEDGPQFGKPDSTEEAPPQTRAALPRWLGAQARLDAALRSSADPMDRAAADLLNFGEMRTPDGSIEAVVQQAATTTDPRLYALGYGLCLRVERAPSCRALSAEGWARTDPGNGMPWVDVLARAQARGDAAAVREALARLASSSRFDTYLLALPGAVANRMPDDEQGLSAANELLVKAVGQAAALPIPRFQPLLQACRDRAGGNDVLAQQCRTISDVMFEHADTLLMHGLSGVLLQQTTGDASRRDFVRAEQARFAAHWSPATGFSQCRNMRDMAKAMVRGAQVGEWEAQREQAGKAVTP